MKKHIIFCITTIILSTFVLIYTLNNSKRISISVSNITELQDALNSTTTPININLTSDMTIDTSLTVNKNVTINGQGHTLKYSSSCTDFMFYIAQNSHLIVSNTIIDGGNNWTWNNSVLNACIEKAKLGQSANENGVAPKITLPETNGEIMDDMIFEVSGNLTLNNNTTIKNLYSVNSSKIIAAVDPSVPAGSININIKDTTITHCSGREGFIAHTKDAIFKLEGSSNLYDIYCYSGLAGLFSLWDTDAYFNNGNIYNNVAITTRSTIFYLNTSKLTINGGNIYNNTSLIIDESTVGAMIESTQDTCIIMNGGSIYSNKGVLAGAISIRWPVHTKYEQKLILNKGTIKDNICLDPTRFNDATGIFTRGITTIGKDMIMEDTITCDQSTCELTHNGNINADIVIRNDAKFTNNGFVNGTLSYIPLIDQYTVNYNYNKGTDIKGYTHQQQARTADTLIPTDSIPIASLKGHTFEGWYTDEEFTNKWDFDNNIVSSNIELYAKYAINEYKATWIVDNTQIDKIFTYNDTIVTPDDFKAPTKSGYHFHGWDNTSSVMSDHDETFKAIFKALKEIPEKNATETSAGNLTYYICSGCNKLFTSDTADKETTLTEVSIPALESDKENIIPTPTSDTTNLDRDNNTNSKSSNNTTNSECVNDVSTWDDNNITLWIIICTISIVSTVITITVHRRKSSK